MFRFDNSHVMKVALSRSSTVVINLWKNDYKEIYISLECILWKFLFIIVDYDYNFDQF